MAQFVQQRDRDGFHSAEAFLNPLALLLTDVGNRHSEWCAHE
jgi:hypothetical protein